MEAPFQVPPSETFEALIGLELVEVGDGTVRARVPVRDAIKQVFGLVHGGLYAALAESIASLGSYTAVADQGLVAIGMSNATTFLRPITEGTVHGAARALQRGRTTWVWDVDITDDAGRLCALSRVTIAIRELQPR